MLPTLIIRQTLTIDCVKLEIFWVLLSDSILTSLPSFGETATVKIIVLFSASATSLVMAFRLWDVICFLDPECKYQDAFVIYLFIILFTKHILPFCLHLSI